MKTASGPKARRCLKLKQQRTACSTTQSCRRLFGRRSRKVSSMKIVFSLLALLLLCQIAFSCSPEEKQATTSQGSSIFAICPNLDTQVREYGNAYVRKDFARLLELTNPKYVE